MYSQEYLSVCGVISACWRVPSAQSTAPCSPLFLIVSSSLSPNSTRHRKASAQATQSDLFLFVWGSLSSTQLNSSVPLLSTSYPFRWMGRTAMLTTYAPAPFSPNEASADGTGPERPETIASLSGGCSQSFTARLHWGGWPTCMLQVSCPTCSGKPD